MSDGLKCHMCGGLTDYYCQDCDEPVCEDCCVPYDQFTQIDYTLCRSCHDGDIAASQLEAYREEEIKAFEQAKKDARNKAARERYWRPENVEKRRKEREERKIKQLEERQRMFAEALKTVNNMMR